MQSWRGDRDEEDEEQQLQGKWKSRRREWDRQEPEGDWGPGRARRGDWQRRGQCEEFEEVRWERGGEE